MRQLMKKRLAPLKTDVDFQVVVWFLNGSQRELHPSLVKNALDANRP